MLATVLVILAAVGAQNGPFTSPRSAAPEYGYGLAQEDSRAGWLALFDRDSTFGWRDATAHSQTISGGQTTSSFGDCEIKGEAASGGKITIGGATVEVKPGKFVQQIKAAQAGPVQLGAGVALKTLSLKPAGLKPVFNGQDLGGWTVVRHPRLAADRQTRWSVTEGALRGVGGPGAVELDGRFADLVLQVEARMRSKLTNGGVFFRSVPGQFMNGYEAQLFNGCYAEDPGRPARYSTGAIDDRQLARRLVSRDLEPFLMTVVARGPHIATWVNGYQTVDWTDTRAKDENPRSGLRLEPGSIQLQAHDGGTDIEFRRIAIAEMK